MLSPLVSRNPDAPIPARATAGAQLRILIVDDDPRVLSMEAIILQRSGYQVDMAENGEAAWKALAGGGYDLLVTDYIMPGISGLALVRQLRVADMTLPVVLVSGSFEQLNMAKLSEDPWSRVDAFLPKPFTVDALVAAVNRVVGLRSPKTESGAAEVDLSRLAGQTL